MGTKQFEADETLKNEFIKDMENEFSDAITYVAKSLLLRKVAREEEELGKNFYNFTPQEIENTLRNFRAKSVGSLNTYWSILAKYLIYAFPRKANVDISMVKMLSSKQLESFVNLVANDARYITREDLYYYLLRAMNPQDQAIIVLLFEGVCGKNYSEITDLKEIDVNFEDRTITTPRKIITITDDKSWFILKEAIKQDCYYTNKEENPEMPINPDNWYVIKRLAYKCDGLDKFSSTRLKIKIQTFTNELGLEHVTGKTIYNSGLAERFLQRFGVEVDPSSISTSEIKKFLESEKEAISPASLRTIARNIQEKLGVA